MIRIALTALATLFVFTACSENDLRGLPPGEGVGGRIQVDPPELVFGTLASYEEDVKAFTITNIGTANLLVVDFEPGGSSSFRLIDPPLDFLLEPGQSRAIDVVFSPMGANDQVGHVVVRSEDPLAPEEQVDLRGVGAAPELYIDPPMFDFFADFVGCGDDVEVSLRNVGTEDLVIDQISYTEPHGQLSLDNPLTLPLVLAPGQDASVWVAWDPTREVLAEGMLSVRSNDPRGTVSATQRAEGIFATVRTDEFEVPVDPPVDILFAVDQSCSMNTPAAALGAAFSTFISSVQQVTNGWRIGVVTHDNGCFNSGVLTQSTPNLATTFANAVDYGSDGMTGFSNTEKLFALTQTAMSKTSSGQCNQNFLRPDALLHVILVSDEYEQSGITASSFVQTLRNYKSSPSLVKVSGIVCPAAGCSWSGSWGTAAGYAEAVNLTGGLRLNVADSSWSSSAQQLAAASLSSINTYPLTGTPAPASIVVMVDGQTWATGWTYDAGSNEIVFTTTPPEGAEIDVRYGMLVPCN